MKKILALLFFSVFLTACSDTAPAPTNPVSADPVSITTEDPAPTVKSEEKPIFLEPITTDITDGATFTIEPVTIKGDAPSGTKFIMVNGKELDTFKTGDAKFIYTPSTKKGDLIIGQNTYDIKVYGESGTLDQQTVVLNFQPGLK